jgi:hypothetical protein
MVGIIIWEKEGKQGEEEAPLQEEARMINFIYKLNDNGS